MMCKHCKDQIGVGEACRAEPTATGSPQYWFYHPSCYCVVKEERQKESPQLELNLLAEQARSVC